MVHLLEQPGRNVQICPAVKSLGTKKRKTKTKSHVSKRKCPFPPTKKMRPRGHPKKTILPGRNWSIPSGFLPRKGVAQKSKRLGPCLHVPGQAVFEFRVFEPQPCESFRNSAARKHLALPFSFAPSFQLEKKVLDTQNVELFAGLAFGRPQKRRPLQNKENWLKPVAASRRP